MPRTEEQYAQLRSDRKNQILDVALQLFSEEGYDRASISVLAKKAGISKGLLYNYFDGKQDVLVSIISRTMEELSDLFDPDHDGILTDEELNFLIDSLFEVIRNNVVFWRLLISLMLQPTVIETSMEELTRFFAPMHGILSTYLESKGFKYPEASARLFLASLDGVAMHYVQDPESFPLEQVKETLKKQYINTKYE